MEVEGGLSQADKMNDLLSKSFARGRNYVDLKKETRRGDVEEGDTEMDNIGGEVDMTRFFDDVNEIKSDMERIKQFLGKIQESNEESKTLHRAQAMKALRGRMDSDIAQVTKIAKAIKTKLEDLDRANAANRRIRGCEEGTPTDRTRTSITSTLRKKLKDLMGDFQILRQKMMGEYKETVERRSVSLCTCTYRTYCDAISCLEQKLSSQVSFIIISPFLRTSMSFRR